jgi:hypothetical protein
VTAAVFIFPSKLRKNKVDVIASDRLSSCSSGEGSEAPASPRQSRGEARNDKSKPLEITVCPELKLRTFNSARLKAGL